MQDTPEFRQPELDLVKACKSVSQIAFDLGVGDMTVCNWR